MKFFVLLFSICCITPAYCWSQKSQPTVKIVGYVYDANKKPVLGATIILDKNLAINHTDSLGRFEIKTAPGDHTLNISHLSYTKQHIDLTTGSQKIFTVADIILLEKTDTLEEYVVTGQFEPMALKNSIYQVRIITSEQIKLRGATTIQTLLNTELGIRLSNDLTLGTTDIQLLGMSGQNVKILLDGIPMTDRGATRESLGQIDINTIDRIEIVEGPMSVLYGTDALAGVINIITKQGKSKDNLSVSARFQEETAQNSYEALSGNGVHNQNVNLNWNHNYWQTEAGITRNNFGGWSGENTGRAKRWMPKDQMLYHATIGFNNTTHFKTWYRLNMTDEDLQSLGNINPNNNKASDKNYLTKRYFHQIQAEYTPSSKFGISLVGSYTDYSRKTLSTNIDFNTGKRTLSTEAGSQDKSTFKTAFSRVTTQYKANEFIAIIAGADYHNNSSIGARIMVNAPPITEYALFIAPEFKVWHKISLRPGLRLPRNSQYKAPTLVPSLNAKWTISESINFRMGYARGFRSPDLRELYFTFFDASHSITGNPDLKAEFSNSLNGSLQYVVLNKTSVKWTTTIGGFYNVFNDLITTAISAKDPAITSYINIEKYQTLGGNMNNNLQYKNLQLTIGYQNIGRYNRYTTETELYGELPTYTWTPELNSNVIYNFRKLKTQVNFAFKFSGKLPVYEIDGETVSLTKRGAFSMADLGFSKDLGKLLRLNIGVRNLFNVTNLTNTSSSTTGAHSSGGSVPMSYGRSYFAGIAFHWSKK